MIENKIAYKNILLATMFIILFGCVLFDSRSYVGNQLLFITFSTIYAIILLTSVIKNHSYFYGFLSLFLFLGFALKANAHFVLGYSLVEPIGLFTNNAQSWDRVLQVSTAGAAGVLCAWFFVQKVLRNYEVVPKVPQWFIRHSRAIFVITIVVALLVCVLNSVFSLYQTGIVPAHILPFKLNILNNWLLGAGFAIWFAAMSWWDFFGRNKLYSRLIASDIISVVMSWSIISRATIMIQTGHYVASLYSLYKQKKLRIKPIIIILLIITLFVSNLLCIELVMFKRDSLYYSTVKHGSIIENVSTPSSELSSFPLNNPSLVKYTKFKSSGTGNIFATLFLKRWIGLEGVMAVSSWQPLGTNLFKQAWTEKPSDILPPLYSKVCHAPYVYGQKTTRNYFASLPGIVAMLYYSGSSWVVFIAMFFIVTLIVLSEFLLKKILNNLFLCSFYGMFLAFLLVNISNIYLFAVAVVEFWLSIFLIWILQEKTDRFWSWISSRSKQSAIN